MNELDLLREIGNPESKIHETYMQWVNNKTTRDVLRILRRLNTPQMARVLEYHSAENEDSALYALGVLNGRDGMLESLEGLVQLSQQLGFAEQPEQKEDFVNEEM